jgi:membrane protease YdiL (CAAX protease family)
LTLSLWLRLPLTVRATLAGLAVSQLSEIPWGGVAGHSGLAGWNSRVFVTMPWAILPMGVFLWLGIRWLGGAGWPSVTSERRRTSLRANPLSAHIWGLSLFAGLIGLASLLPLTRIMSRLVVLPAEAEPIAAPPQTPFITMFLLLVMASIVAGVGEEAAFRGYMQGPIEGRHGPTVAILWSGTVFGLLHYTHHPGSVFAMLPFYVAVSTVYGGLAYATNSILPGVVLHTAGDVFSLTRLWTSGQAEWQASAGPPPTLIWQTGIDGLFVRSVVVFLVFSAAAVWAYSALARATRVAPRPDNLTQLSPPQ